MEFVETQETTEDRALRAHLVSQVFMARKVFEETVDQREDRALQERQVPKVSRVMTRKATRDLRESQVFLEIEVLLVTPISLLGCQQFYKSPVTEDQRVKREMLEAKVNVDHAEWMEKPACLAVTDSREKKET